MIKSIKTGIILLAALLLAWLLPWCYAFVFASPSWSPFTLYSCVTHGFASVDFDRENNVAGRDLQGNTYTQQQFDSILPTFYYRQLAAEGRFPSEIEGVAVESRDVERTNFMFRTSPGEINRRRPTVYQLLESMPDRIDLEPATDVFRITGEGIEFVDMETNTIDQKKSAAFTKVLRDKGFSFPARVVSGNPSTRKRYDNGYLLVDDALAVTALYGTDKLTVYRPAIPPIVIRKAHGPWLHSLYADEICGHCSTENQRLMPGAVAFDDGFAVTAAKLAEPAKFRPETAGALRRVEYESDGAAYLLIANFGDETSTPPLPAGAKLLAGSPELEPGAALLCTF